jgi:hypothetical protein
VNDALKFLAKLVFFSAVLFMARDIIATIYSFFLLGSCYLMGIRFTQGTALYESSLRMIPFIALMLATPRLGIKKRAVVIALGFVLFLAIDLTSILIWRVPPSRTQISGSKAHLLYSLIWELCGHWLLPLVIWVVAAKEEILQLLGGIIPGPQAGPAQSE